MATEKTFIPEFTASKQAGLFRAVKEPQFTGQILIEDGQKNTWIFHIYLGRIIYATGGIHPVRRFKRNLSAYFSEMMPEFIKLEKDPNGFANLTPKVCWEYDLLSFWQQEGKIAREFTRLMINSQVGEILFDLTQAKQVSFELKPAKFVLNPLILIDSEQVIVQAWKNWQAWQNAQIADRSPNNAPIISQSEELQKRTSAKTYQQMSKFLDGKRSLRDLAFQLKQDLVQITRLLMPYLQSGLIDLIEIPDLSTPISLLKCKNNNPLIACIDDSPQVCQTLEVILTEAGYQFIGITDDLRAMALLLNHQPDLIFLDLVMPHTNGYEICRQLRKVTRFHDTPIVLISQNINVVDRFKAKLTGFSDLLDKPITTQPLLSLLNKHLSSKIINL